MISTFNLINIRSIFLVQFNKLNHKLTIKKIQLVIVNIIKKIIICN